MQSFVVDRDGWEHAEMVEACRAVLSAAQGTAAEYRVDVPAVEADWPPEVLAAAEVLRAAAGQTGRVDKGGYARTGRLPVAADETWAAFLVFAPWAYDATVWNDRGQPTVSLADESQSIVVHLEMSQVEHFARAVRPARLVTETAWRKLVKERRRR
ncbi:hypothetical protein AB0P21_13405 [Kribbella sp. NPDC056861]|uniref:hypothetical protein n=1 Tax=Kribbella sp. NPDC056861 TaxID=3154857 RepID=UPI0034238D88